MAKRKISNFEVHFDDKWNMYEHSDRWRQHKNVQLNAVFSDTLEYVGYISAGRGGNSKIKLKSLNSNRTYIMFISDFDIVVKAKKFIDNLIVGNFVFVKKGAAQGISLILENDDF